MRSGEARSRVEHPASLHDRAIQALEVHLDERNTIANREKRREADILRKLVKTVLDLDTKPEERYVRHAEFRFSYRVEDGSPQLYAWWGCPDCTSRGAWKKVDRLVDLGAVAAEYRIHKTRGQCRRDVTRTW